jgi:hypothetical protein
MTYVKMISNSNSPEKMRHGYLISVSAEQFRNGQTMSNIFDAFEKIAEKKIREAMDNGEFDDLPGKGKPLDLEDDSHIPQDIRLAHKILKNAGCLPPELELRKEILTMEELLDGVRDTKEKYRQIKKLNYLIMKLNVTRRSAFNLERNQIYYDRLVEKMGKKDEAN